MAEQLKAYVTLKANNLGLSPNFDAKSQQTLDKSHSASNALTAR